MPFCLLIASILSFRAGLVKKVYEAKIPSAAGLWLAWLNSGGHWKLRVLMAELNAWHSFAGETLCLCFDGLECMKFEVNLVCLLWSEFITWGTNSSYPVEPTFGFFRHLFSSASFALLLRDPLLKMRVLFPFLLRLGVTWFLRTLMFAALPGLCLRVSCLFGNHFG